VNINKLASYQQAVVDFGKYPNQYTPFLHHSRVISLVLFADFEVL
jgi:hypothetical protein